MQPEATGSGEVDLSLQGRIFCYICLNMFYLPKHVEIFFVVLESGGFPVPEGPRTCAK